MIGRRFALWFAAAVSVLFIAHVQTASAAGGDLPCNTAVELCDRTLDQVVLPGTHNSMSNEEYSWMIPNQHYSIPTQLEMGIRAFLIDTHYGKPDPGATPSGVAAWNSAVDGDPHANGAGTYLCHTTCQMGASDLATEFGKVTSFLKANPREVLVFVVEDGINADDFAAAVTSSGLLDHLYTGSTEAFPTLEQMISTDQRVVMVSEGHRSSSIPWFKDGYAGPLQETPYDFRRDSENTPLTTAQAMNQLIDPTKLDWTCRPNRGGTSGPLFLMNHWVNGRLSGGDPFTPDAAVAEQLNAKDVLVNRARACQTRRGKLPTIVAVDQFGTGALLEAVDELNGVVRPDPTPTPTSPRLTVKKPKNLKVRAGKVATFRLPVTNGGDAAAGSFRVCAKGPGRLTRGKTCIRVKSLGVGKTTVVKLKVRTKPRAKGKGAVKFTLLSPNGNRTTKATLAVTPKRR